MLKVLENNISYTKGDTFELKVSSKTGFSDGSHLRFTVSENEAGEPLVERSYSLSGDAFLVTLTDEDKRRLEIGSYIYKISIVSVAGVIVTEASGDFLVKWGA